MGGRGSRSMEPKRKRQSKGKQKTQQRPVNTATIPKNMNTYVNTHIKRAPASVKATLKANGSMGSPVALGSLKSSMASPQYARLSTLTNKFGATTTMKMFSTFRAVGATIGKKTPAQLDTFAVRHTSAFLNSVA